VQLTQVGRAALGQIGVRLGGHPGRHGGKPHQLGIGRLLTAEHHDRRRAAQKGIESFLPRPPATEDPHDHHVDPVDQRGKVVNAGAGRVGEPIAGTARTGTEQIGV